MSLPGNKRRIVIAAFVIAGLFVLAQTSFALAPPSATQGLLEKPIPFNFAAGINFQNLTANVTNVGPELLAQYISELTYFFLRLAVVLAVLMITIGGFQWLIALGNASKISNAKDTIQQALIGLMLALTSYLMFSQIDKSFVELKSLDILGKSDSLTLKCDTYFTKATCDNPALHPGLTCGWSCDPYDVAVNLCSNDKKKKCTVSSDCGTSGEICEKQQCCSSSAVFGQCTGDCSVCSNPFYSGQGGGCQDSPSLEKVLNCLYSQGPQPFIKTSTSNGTHAPNSCHFGGRTCKDGAHAVDFVDPAGDYMTFTHVINDAIGKCATQSGVQAFCRCENRNGDILPCGDATVNHMHCNVDNNDCLCN